MEEEELRVLRERKRDVLQHHVLKLLLRTPREMEHLYRRLITTDLSIKVANVCLESWWRFDYTSFSSPIACAALLRRHYEEPF